jgi:hypothetical protein
MARKSIRDSPANPAFLGSTAFLLQGTCTAITYHSAPLTALTRPLRWFGRAEKRASEEVAVMSGFVALHTRPKLAINDASDAAHDGERNYREYYPKPDSPAV